MTSTTVEPAERPGPASGESHQAPPEPRGIDWIRCAGCATLLPGPRFARDLRTCRDCGWHAPLSAGERIDQLLDPDSVTPIDTGADQAVVDPLGFVDRRPYRDRLAEARQRTGLPAAAIAVRGTVDGVPVVAVVMDFRFLGGSLGMAEGDAVVAGALAARADDVPFLLVTSSGGARMQEGALALMQMARTSQAMTALADAGVLTICVVADPTYGGVAASFATLADIILIEPGARFGFAGPRVIQQTIGAPLPEGFQRAESLLAHGLVDDVVPRRALRGTLRSLLGFATTTRRPPAAAGPDPLIREAHQLPDTDPWETVVAGRNILRPTTLDHAGVLLDGFVELHGDRLGADSPAIVGGLGWLDGIPVMLVGHEKGHDTRKLVAHDFGLAGPEGYRKAARLMSLAAKLRIPVVTLVDTQGAHPGVEAEQHGQAGAIAASLGLMAGLRTPTVAVILGEGGSGGALALALADRVLIMQYAFYSVISPEGCAAILWREPAATREAARRLGLDARALLELGVVDAVVPEPPGGARHDDAAATEILGAAIRTCLIELADRDEDTLVEHRRARYRRFGLTAATRGGAS